MKSIRVDAERNPIRDSIALYFYDRLPQGGSTVGKNIVFEKVEDFTEIEPTIYLTMSNAQELIDRLWACGLRPTEGTGSAGSLRATENHLKDMQNLVDRLMKIMERE